MKKEGFVFLGVLLLFLFYGQSRLAFASRHAETLPVALISVERNSLSTLDNFNPEEYEQLFDVSRKAAKAGASAIVWSEVNAVVTLDFEDELIELGKSFAKDYQVFLFMSCLSSSYSRLNENKTIGISPRGDIVLHYLKSKLVPGQERRLTKSGDGKVGLADIDGIRTGHAICYDMDFPSYIQQAGNNNVDIMFAPAGDQREIADFHATVARFRAIENGFSLVRPAGSEGVSIATDPFGRILSYQDSVSSKNNISIVDIPARGVRTFYAIFGDLFSFICMFALAALLIYTCFSNRNLHNKTFEGC